MIHPYPLQSANSGLLPSASSPFPIAFPSASSPFPSALPSASGPFPIAFPSASSPFPSALPSASGPFHSAYSDPLHGTLPSAFHSSYSYPLHGNLPSAFRPTVSAEFVFPLSASEVYKQSFQRIAAEAIQEYKNGMHDTAGKEGILNNALNEITVDKKTGDKSFDKTIDEYERIRRSIPKDTTPTPTQSKLNFLSIFANKAPSQWVEELTSYLPSYENELRLSQEGRITGWVYNPRTDKFTPAITEASVLGSASAASHVPVSGPVLVSAPDAPHVPRSAPAEPPVPAEPQVLHSTPVADADATLRLAFATARAKQAAAEVARAEAEAATAAAELAKAEAAAAAAPDATVPTFDAFRDSVDELIRRHQKSDPNTIPQLDNVIIEFVKVADHDSNEILRRLLMQRESVATEDAVDQVLINFFVKEPKPKSVVELNEFFKNEIRPLVPYDNGLTGPSEGVDTMDSLRYKFNELNRKAGNFNYYNKHNLIPQKILMNVQIFDTCREILLDYQETLRDTKSEPLKENKQINEFFLRGLDEIEKKGKHLASKYEPFKELAGFFSSAQGIKTLDELHKKYWEFYQGFASKRPAAPETHGSVPVVPGVATETRRAAQDLPSSFRESVDLLRDTLKGGNQELIPYDLFTVIKEFKLIADQGSKDLLTRIVDQGKTDEPKDVVNDALIAFFVKEPEPKSVAELNSLFKEKIGPLAPLHNPIEGLSEEADPMVSFKNKSIGLSEKVGTWHYYYKHDQKPQCSYMNVQIFDTCREILRDYQATLDTHATNPVYKENRTINEYFLKQLDDIDNKGNKHRASENKEFCELVNFFMGVQGIEGGISKLDIEYRKRFQGLVPVRTAAPDAATAPAAEAPPPAAAGAPAAEAPPPAAAAGAPAVAGPVPAAAEVAAGPVPAAAAADTDPLTKIIDRLSKNQNLSPTDLSLTKEAKKRLDRITKKSTVVTDKEIDEDLKKPCLMLESDRNKPASSADDMSSSNSHPVYPDLTDVPSNAKSKKDGNFYGASGVNTTKRDELILLGDTKQKFEERFDEIYKKLEFIKLWNNEFLENKIDVDYSTAYDPKDLTKLIKEKIDTSRNLNDDKAVEEKMKSLPTKWKKKELNKDEKSEIYKQSLNATKLALEMGDISRDDEGNSCKMIKVSRTGVLPKSSFDIKFYYPEDGDFIRVCIDFDKNLYAKFKHDNGKIKLDSYEKKQDDKYVNHVLKNQDLTKLGGLEFNVSLIDEKSKKAGSTPEDKIITLEQKTRIFKFKKTDSLLSVVEKYTNKLIFASDKFKVSPENLKGSVLDDDNSAHRAIHATLNDQFDRYKSLSSSPFSTFHTMYKRGENLMDFRGNKDRIIDVVITNSKDGNTIRANTTPSQNGIYSIERMGKNDRIQERQ